MATQPGNPTSRSTRVSDADRAGQVQPWTPQTSVRQTAAALRPPQGDDAVPAGFLRWRDRPGRVGGGGVAGDAAGDGRYLRRGPGSPHRRGGLGGGCLALLGGGVLRLPAGQCCPPPLSVTFQAAHHLIPYRCSRLPRCSSRALFSVAYIAERDRPLMSISLVTAAVQAVPGAENAAIILVLGRKTVQSHAATSPRARRMDELQTELRDGPCLTAIWEQETVHIPDMAAESRWPRFAAAEAGVGAMLCFQLFVHGDDDHLKVIQIVGQLVEDASVDTGIDEPGQSDCQRPLADCSPLRFRQ